MEHFDGRGYGTLLCQGSWRILMKRVMEHFNDGLWNIVMSGVIEHCDDNACSIVMTGAMEHCDERFHGVL